MNIILRVYRRAVLAAWSIQDGARHIKTES